jgi:drug/metabolite transporter (DMT)-like permease
MSESAIRNDRSVTPLLVAALAVFSFSILDAMLKGATARVPVLEVIFLRFVAGAIFASIIFARTGQSFPGIEAFRANLIRAAVMVVSSFGLVYAVSVLPLADAIVLGYSTPIFLALFGRLLLSEPVPRRAFAAIALGALGVAVMFHSRLSLPNGFLHILGSASALLSAAAYALSMILARMRSARDSIEFTIWAQNFFSMLLAIPGALLVWQAPSIGDLGYFGIVGLVAMVAHFLIVWAFTRAAAARLAPLEFTGLIWAGLLGFLFFHEQPGIEILLGAMLIAASGIIIATGRSQPVENG